MDLIYGNETPSLASAFPSSVPVGAAPATLGQQCSDDFQKVTQCLSYATGKAATPAKDCCTAVKDIKDSEPVCLCYIMQQTHNGSEQIKELGIQEDRLLQLPTACKLTNASISDCPKLLNIPASSPDYAIFTNTSSSMTTPSTTTGTSSPETAAHDSNGSYKHGVNVAGPMAIAVAIFFCVIPVGFASALCR
ncbi:hypothetical protein F0562_033150 [Nyssa sinensis]|uniref:Bifunctional inhibitor/plant lipid transfer protein/seed storage helical domain-containing protein n=1 Tax=Nyssa sinensis TaxID=561372 RepID=A0A5J5AV43_9ASTE|nr:hypothetical protein F0562_033150 [Nyssa sinensis]